MIAFVTGTELKYLCSHLEIADLQVKITSTVKILFPGNLNNLLTIQDVKEMHSYYAMISI